MDDRRQFDRVVIPATAEIFANDDQGNRLGRIRILGRGGFLLQTARRFPINVPLVMVIVAEREGIRRTVDVVQRYVTPEGNGGFEFRSLSADAAVEIGVLIGKYFSAEGAAK